MRTMQNNVLEYLENIVDRVADKIAYADENSGATLERFSINPGQSVPSLVSRAFTRSPW